MQNSFTDNNLTQISDLVKDHFPSFYKEQGPIFIEFVKAYYEWMEQPDNPIGRSRTLYKNYDIDTTANAFLQHFKEKYMWGLPPELLGNQRLLQKHILELYRAKGSEQAVKLLFRLLFNEDVTFYIPSYDIFKLSDNTWNWPHYIECTYTDEFENYIGKMITGSDSGAVAIVESYESRFINNKFINLLYVSNIRGTFIPDETLLADGVDLDQVTTVIGSVTKIKVNSSSPGINVGTSLTATIGEFPVEIVVADTYEGTGTLRFDIARPGSYYTLDATFDVKPPVHQDYLLPIAEGLIANNVYGFNKDPLADVDSIIGDSIWIAEFDNIVPDSVVLNLGAGADIQIYSLKDTMAYQLTVDRPIDYLTVELDDNYPFPKLPTSNLSTIVDDSLSSNTIIVGSINEVLINNPGFNYTANVWFIPIDPYTSTTGIKDANGMFVGQNGLIVGEPIIGEALANNVVITNSGFNNIDYSSIVFRDNNDFTQTVRGEPEIEGVGWSKGFYENTKSFLSDDKYLFDGHYYQDFSYVIRSAMTLDSYVNILKSLVHPAGNAVYADIRISKTNKLNNDAYATYVKTEDFPDWVDRGPDGTIPDAMFDFENNRGIYKGRMINNLVSSLPTDPNLHFTRASPATYTDSNDILQIANNNILRIDHAPTTGARFEDVGYNLLINSRLAGAASGSPGTAPTNWTYPLATGSTTVLLSDISGVNKITFSSGASGRMFANQNISLEANKTYTLSAKADLSSNTLQIDYYIWFSDFPTGTTFQYLVDDVVVSNTYVVPAGKHTLGVRIAVDSTAGSATMRFGVGVQNNVANAVATFELPQLEEGITRTSWIPTTTSTETRQNDSLIYNKTNETNTESIFIRGYTPVSTHTFNDQTLWSSDDNTDKNYIKLVRDFNSDIRLIMRENDTEKVNLNLGNLPNSVGFSVACSWDGVNFIASLNGMEPISTTYDEDMPVLNTIRIGTAL